MNITIKASELSRSLSNINKAVENRNTIPILQWWWRKPSLTFCRPVTNEGNPEVILANTPTG
jgi:hypothetical protein